MKTAIVLVALLIGLATVYSVSSYIEEQRQQARAMARRGEIVSVLQAVAPRARWARDSYNRTGGVCDPPQTAPHPLPAGAGGSGLCWPVTDGGCLRVDPKVTVCLATNQTLAGRGAVRSPASWVSSLFITETWAQYFNPMTPPEFGSRDGSVSVRSMACGDPDMTGCIDCSDPSTDCFTVVFCVGRPGVTAPNCPPRNRLAQTFVRRDQ